MEQMWRSKLYNVTPALKKIYWESCLINSFIASVALI